MKQRSVYLSGFILSALLGTSAVAAPETYVIDGSHTFPRFSYDHLGLSTQLSTFKKTTGTIIYDKAAKTASVDITIDTRSVETGFPVFNEHIQAEDYLHTEKFPVATFKSTRVVFQGDKPATIEGELTLKGVTRPVTLTVTNFVNKPHPIRKTDAIGADAKAVIKRSAFNMGKNAPAVGDDVTISIALEAAKK